MDYDGLALGKPTHETQKQRRARRRRKWNKSKREDAAKLDFICPKCGRQGLQAHHKKPLKMGGSNLEELHDYETNGDPVCQFCHGKEHLLKPKDSKLHWSSGKG